MGSSVAARLKQRDCRRCQACCLLACSCCCLLLLLLLLLLHRCFTTAAAAATATPGCYGSKAAASCLSACTSLTECSRRASAGV